MKRSRRIVMYGNSVIMGALRATLRRAYGHEVISLAPSQQRRLDAISPDVVVFDLDAACLKELFSLLETRPTLMLIGVRPDTGAVKVWSGRTYRRISTQELIRVIDGQRKMRVYT
jgi:hypothetical protein